MMVAGIAILGTVTAAVASWLVERVQEAAEPENEVLRRIEDLQAQVGRLTICLEGRAPDAVNDEAPRP
jgi:voltage-gated potassium channel